jgi:hypothetical protein
MATTTREVNVNLTRKRANKIIFEPLFKSMLDLNLFTVMPNVYAKERLIFMQHMTKILQKDIGCKFNPKGSADMYDRWIETEPVKANVEICADQFKNHIIGENWLKTGTADNDLTGTQIASLLISLVRDAVPEDCKKLFWFGNKASTDDFFNCMDGLWPVHLKNLAVNHLAPYVDTNSGTALGAGDALALLKEMYNSQANVLAGLPDSEKRFYVTKSIYQQYFDDTANLGGGDAGRFQILNGQNVLVYRGIPVVQDVTWDDHQTNELGQPNSHLALLTIPKNLVMATDFVGDKNKIEFWYDRKDEVNLQKAKFKLGANVVHGAFLVIGF